MKKNDLVKQIAALVKEQRRILAAFLVLHPEVLTSRAQEWPQRGTVDVEGDVFRYSRHGLGYTFVRKKDRRCIEVHEFLERPDAFDAFRLSEFLGADDEGEDEMPGIQEMLNDLRLAGVIAVVQGTEHRRYSSYTMVSEGPISDPLDNAS